MNRPPQPDRFVVAADATPDLSFASVVIAGWIDDQRILVERAVAESVAGERLQDHRAGLSWVIPRMKDLKSRYHSRIRGFIIDPISPAASLLNEAEHAGLDIIKPSTRDVGQAFGQFLSWVSDKHSPVRLVHLGEENPDLRLAVAGATRREIGDGQYAWSRRTTTVDISPLCAATLAAWGAYKYCRRRDLSKTIVGPTF